MKHVLALPKAKLWISFAIIALLAGYFVYQQIIVPEPFFFGMIPKYSIWEFLSHF